MRKELGKYIFSDPRLGEGELRFTGTRISVKGALELASRGYSAKAIAEQYHELISEEAVMEAIALASELLIKRYDSARRKHPKRGARKTAKI